MFKNYRIIVLFLSILILLPQNGFSAQILQINSSSRFQIGDRNRVYTVQLPCLEVPHSNEENAIIWLRAKLRGKKRVNLQPEGLNNGVLVARVSLLGSQIDLGEALEEKGLAKKTC